MNRKSDDDGGRLHGAPAFSVLSVAAFVFFAALIYVDCFLGNSCYASIVLALFYRFLFEFWLGFSILVAVTGVLVPSFSLFLITLFIDIVIELCDSLVQSFRARS